MAKGFGIIKDSLHNSRKYIGVGYIFIPDNFKEGGRFDFVKNCYRNHRVSIILDEGLGIKHNCFILDHVLREIKFPDFSISEQQKGKLGSQIVFINEPYHDHTIIIGVLNKRDETSLFSENEYRIIRDNKGKYALLSINGNNGSISLESFGGDIDVQVTNEGGDSKLNLKVGGVINLISTGGININTTEDINVYTAKNINLQATLTNIGEENLESALRGDTTVEQLDIDMQAMLELQNGIKNWTPVPNDGGAALKVALTTFLNKTMADYSNTKSTKLFLE